MCLTFRTVGSVSHRELPCVCNQSLGMEDGRIPDGSISASSLYPTEPMSSHEAANSRLYFKVGNDRAGAWSARYNNKEQWLQIDFCSRTHVTQVATQGRDAVYQWVRSYSLSYSMDGVTFYSYQNDKVNTVESR